METARASGISFERSVLSRLRFVSNTKSLLVAAGRLQAPLILVVTNRMSRLMKFCFQKSSVRSPQSATPVSSTDHSDDFNQSTLSSLTM
jgi:hypothetical protein